ncbi:MAG: hypothetical protein LBB53_00440 [Prevotellaceae bacterium]|jgi:hypothetical protein|nr:hypothetical protein [Prevotellaceae bacterium]
MDKKTAIKLFDSKQIRTAWNEDTEEWYFSVVDIIEVLTDSLRPRKYWNALKTKLQEEGSEVSQFLGYLKVLASVGNDRINETVDTELSIERAILNYRRLG